MVPAWVAWAFCMSEIHSNHGRDVRATWHRRPAQEQKLRCPRKRASPDNSRLASGRAAHRFDAMKAPRQPEEILRRVMKLSRLNGWSVAIFAGLCTLVSVAVWVRVGASGCGLVAIVVELG